MARKSWHETVHSCFFSLVISESQNLVHIFLFLELFYFITWYSIFFPIFKCSSIIQREMWWSSMCRWRVASILYHCAWWKGCCFWHGLSDSVTETTMLAVNTGTTSCITALCILNHLQCFWSTFTRFCANRNCYCLVI